MTPNEIVQLILGVILSFGGAGAIIYVLSSYFGKLWADKHLESIKSEYQQELETHRTKLDMIKETASRYSSQQFELYNKLWHSLYELKLAADALWDVASEGKLKKFVRQLKKTIDEVEKSCLFIEDDHYETLSNLLNEFKNYRGGKKNLIESMKRGESLYNDEIQDLIENNRWIREEYNRLIIEIRTDLKKQLRGEN